MRLNFLFIFIDFSWLTFRGLVLLFFLVDSFNISAHDSWSWFVGYAELVLVRLWSGGSKSAWLFGVEIRAVGRMISLDLFFFFNYFGIDWSWGYIIILWVLDNVEIDVFLRGKFEAGSLFWILFLFIGYFKHLFILYVKRFCF